MPIYRTHGRHLEDFALLNFGNRELLHVGGAMSNREFARRFDEWLRLTGLRRVELIALLNRASQFGEADSAVETVELVRAAMLWLYRPATGTAVPSLVLDIIEEYAEAVSQEASKGIQYASELRQATDALIASATALIRTTAQPCIPRLSVQLTGRERQILALISDALPNRQIALALNISEKTVKNHITSLFTKLGVASRTEALVIALQSNSLR